MDIDNDTDMDMDIEMDTDAGTDQDMDFDADMDTDMDMDKDLDNSIFKVRQLFLAPQKVSGIEVCLGTLHSGSMAPNVSLCHGS